MTSFLYRANPNMFLIGLALVIIGSDIICVGALGPQLGGRWCSEDKHCDPGEWCRPNWPTSSLSPTPLLPPDGDDGAVRPLPNC